MLAGSKLFLAIVR